MKRYKQRKEQRLVRKSRKVIDKLRWDEAVGVLTVALGQAIWREGGDRDDAMATMEIVHCAIVVGLDAWFDAKDRTKSPNVIPFKRKKGYP
jgi:hypothetical protein